MSDYPYKAKRRVEALIDSCETLVKPDPEQEVQGLAVPVLEASLDDIDPPNMSAGSERATAKPQPQVVIPAVVIPAGDANLTLRGFPLQ